MSEKQPFDRLHTGNIVLDAIYGTVLDVVGALLLGNSTTPDNAVPGQILPGTALMLPPVYHPLQRRVDMRRNKMQTASLDLCKELHGLSGWDDTYHRWSKDIYGHDVVIDILAAGTTVPAYDLGYLLRKLPTRTVIKKEHDASPELPEETPAHFRALYDTVDGQHFWLGADTPEDAACELAIELFKHGVICR